MKKMLSWKSWNFTSWNIFVNIHINEENREDINGILQISLKNIKDFEHAKKVISENTDYKVYVN